jgi:hypothetical protein
MQEQEVIIRNPFPGLRPFDVSESLIFFGRDGLSDTLLEKLRAARFVAVVGTSGSGKSSLVRAGLLPALRGGFMKGAGSGWRIALFRPVNNPIGNLAQALSETGMSLTGGAEPPAGKESAAAIEEILRSNSLGLIEVVRRAEMSAYENLLIVVDQFEELYRFEPSPEVEHPREEASAFVKLLLEATLQTDLPIYIILTMRSDYLGESAHFWGLPEAINRGQFLIPRMDDDERREAIEGPVRVFGAKMSSPLVNRLLNDAGDDPSQLPILQHALMRTWDYWVKHGRQPETLGIKQYDNPEVGGMDRALSIHADEAYEELGEEQKSIAEKMFKRLTEKGADAREGRLPATVRELGAITGSDEVVAIIETFRKEGRSFLMPPIPQPLTPDTLVDISHESLIRGWDRLRTWVEEEADSAKIYLRIVDDALRYPRWSALLTDPELQLALDWREKQQPNEAWARRYMTEYGRALAGNDPPPRPAWAEAETTEFAIANKYLDMSRDARDSAVAQKERRQRWTLITLTGVAAVFLALAIVATFFYISATRAKAAAETAQWQALTAKDKVEQSYREAEDARRRADQAREEANQAKTTAEERAREADKAKTALAAALVVAQKARADALRQAGIAEQRGKKLTAFGRLGEATNKLLGAMTSNSLSNKGNDSEELVEAFQSMRAVYADPEFAAARVREFFPPNESILDLLTAEAMLKDKSLDASRAFPFFEQYGKAAFDLLRRSNLLDPSRNPTAEINVRFAEEILGVKERDEKEAIPYLQKGIAAFDDKKSARRKADALVKLGEISEPFEARLAFNDAATLYHAALDDKEAETREKLGDIFIKLGDQKSAKSQYEAAAALFRDNLGGGTDASVLNKLGELFEFSDQSKAAEYFWLAAVAYQAAGDYMKSGIVFSQLGNLYKDKDEELALKAYEEAHLAFVKGKIESNPDKTAQYYNGWVLESAGNIYISRKDNAKAISTLKLALERYEKADFKPGVERVKSRLEALQKE